MLHPKHVLFSLKNIYKKMNFKSIMWFIKALSFYYYHYYYYYDYRR